MGGHMIETPDHEHFFDGGTILNTRTFASLGVKVSVG